MKKIIAIIVAVVLVVGGAVGAYFFLKPEKQEEIGTVSIEVTKGGFVETISVIERYMKTPEKYKESMPGLYGMTAEDAENFFAAPENWLAYDYTVTIKNTGEETVSVYGFEFEGNGDNDVFLSKQFGGELGLPAGADYAIPISVLCANGDATTDEVLEAVEKKTISVIYSKQPSEADDGTETVEETKKAALDIK